MASSTEFLSDIISLTVSLSVDAAMNLVDDGGLVMPTSRFCHKRNAQSTNQRKR